MEKTKGEDEPRIDYSHCVGVVLTRPISVRIIVSPVSYCAVIRIIMGADTPLDD